MEGVYTTKEAAGVVYERLDTVTTMRKRRLEKL